MATNTLKAFILFFLYAVIPAQGQDWPPAFEVDSVKSTVDGVYQPFYYYSSHSAHPNPLVVSLHQWSSNYQHIEGSLAKEVEEKNWNFIHPNFRGPNNHVKACGSKYVLADISQAIDWAMRHMKVDTSNIYIVGASGGGYAALCSFMKLKQPVAAYMAFVPISNLEAWYRESLSRKKKYARDILKCTGSNGNSLNIDEAHKRSPIFWQTPIGKLKRTKLFIYDGIHDGHKGDAVPITQSISFYNKLLKDLDADKKAYVPQNDIIYMLTREYYPNNKNETIGNRKIFYQKNYGNIQLTIFDGGHEILEAGALHVLSHVYQNSLRNH